MAVVLLDGFDHLSGPQHAVKGWTGGNYQVVAGRFGGQALRVHADVGQSLKALPSTYSTIYAGIAIQPTSTGDHFLFKGSGSSVVKLQLISSGPNQFWRVTNGAGTTIATGTTPITSSVWYYLEFKCVVSATVGIVEVRLNGLSTSELVATGLNTGTTNIDQIVLNSPVGITAFDDVYVVDTTGSPNTFLGDSIVSTTTVASEGFYTAFTANTGTKISRVNDSGSYDSDTGYLVDANPGDRQTFTVNPIGNGTVYAVQVNTVARKDNSGTRTIAPVLRIAGTTYDGTTTAGLSASYLDYIQLYSKQDPSSADWTVSTINAMEVGVKEVA